MTTEKCRHCKKGVVRVKVRGFVEKTEPCIICRPEDAKNAIKTPLREKGRSRGR